MPLIRLFNRLPLLYRIPAMMTGIIVLVGLTMPLLFSQGLSHLNQWIYDGFGHYYLWFTLLVLIGTLLLGLSPLGSIRLGGADAKAEFSTFAWFSMLFGAGMGTGLMIWGGPEPLYHFANPPLAGITSTTEKSLMALHFTFLHWGLHPWAIYTLTGIAIAFFAFNLNKGLTFSGFLLPAEPGPLQQKLKTTIDLFTVLAIVFGVTATFGMGILQVQGALQTLLHIQPTPFLTTLLVITMTIAFLVSANKGIEKGIKVLSSANFFLYLILLGSIVVLGMQWIDFGAVLQTVPAYLARLPGLSVGWADYQSPLWIKDWTAKYWSWWIAWAPFVGIFIAFISKGRTIRQLIMGSLFLPTLFCGIWFTIWGQTAIGLQQATRFAGATVDLSQVNLLLFQMLGKLSPLTILPLLCTLIISLDFINSADSAAYTVASLSNGDAQAEPPQHLRLAWGSLFGLLAIVFLLSGGIPLLQQITLITALPFSFILALVFVRLFWCMVRYRQNTRQHADNVAPLPQGIGLSTASTLNL